MGGFFASQTNDQNDNNVTAKEIEQKISQTGGIKNSK
jgi:hypothetical protein